MPGSPEQLQPKEKQIQIVPKIPKETVDSVLAETNDSRLWPSIAAKTAAKDPELFAALQAQMQPQITQQEARTFLLAAYRMIEERISGKKELPSEQEVAAGQYHAELSKLESNYQTLKNDLEALGNDEKATRNYFEHNFYSIESSFWNPYQEGTPEERQIISSKQQEIKDWLKEKYSYGEIPLELSRTRYDDRLHNIMQPGGLVFDKYKSEGTVAEVLSPGFEYKGKIIKKTVIRIYAHLR